MEEFPRLIDHAHHFFHRYAGLTPVQFHSNTQTAHMFLPWTTTVERSIAMRKLCQASKQSGANSRIRSHQETAVSWSPVSSAADARPWSAAVEPGCLLSSHRAYSRARSQ